MCEATFAFYIAIIFLYVWAHFAPINYYLAPIGGNDIGNIAAIISAFGAVVSLVCRFDSPKIILRLLTFGIYLIFVATTVVIIYESKDLLPPFIFMWIIAALFAGYFGIMAAIGMSLLVVVHVLLAYTQTGIDERQISTTLFFGLVPLILSVIIWRRSAKNKSGNGSYSALKHKISNAQGKSDIVINAIDDGVLALSPKGIVELINPAAQKLIGWDKGDALGLSWQSVLKLVTIDGKDVTEQFNPVEKSLAANTTEQSDRLMLLTSSGKKRLIYIISSPIDGKESGVIVVFRDISKEKAEEREQAEFISTASHEMRTPIATIEGYLGLALNPATANIDDRARDFITKAHLAAGHLGRLFQDLLDISKAEDGRLKNDPKIININDFVSNVFDEFILKAKDKQLDYIYKPSEQQKKENKELRPVYYSCVDPDHLREILENLIENAIKYTLVGEVTVDISGDDKTVSISVSDNGIGIPAEDMPHLFQKFYRVDTSETREIGGTGLGLYLSRQLAETMSGRLYCESEYKKGSTFFLELPRMNNDEALEKIKEDTVARTNNQPSSSQDDATTAPEARLYTPIPDGLNLKSNTGNSTIPAQEPIKAEPTKSPAPSLSDIEKYISSKKS